MPVSRKKHSAQFKAKVTMEALRESKTMAELSSEFAVHSTQIARWKKQVIEDLPKLFEHGANREDPDLTGLTTQLYEQIGRLQVELEWLKKKSGTRQ